MMPLGDLDGWRLHVEPERERVVHEDGSANATNRAMGFGLNFSDMGLAVSIRTDATHCYGAHVPLAVLVTMMRSLGWRVEPPEAG